MREDGDNLLAFLAARQRGTRNDKISFKIFKKVLLGRQFKQVNGGQRRQHNQSTSKRYRIQNLLSQLPGNQSKQLAGFSLSIKKGLKHQGDHSYGDERRVQKQNNDVSMRVCFLVMIMVQMIIMTTITISTKTINFLSAQFPQFGGFRIPRSSGKALDCYLLATNMEKMEKVINFAAWINNNI